MYIYIYIYIYIHSWLHFHGEKIQSGVYIYLYINGVLGLEPQWESLSSMARHGLFCSSFSMLFFGPRFQPPFWSRTAPPRESQIDENQPNSRSKALPKDRSQNT